jgi:hypothetical protein
MKILFIVVMFGLLMSSVEAKDNRRQNFPKSVELVKKFPKKENVWVFILAGQSNMAGRGLVEPHDTVSHNRIWTINPKGEVVYGKEPFHFYEDEETALDCGLSFGRTLIKSIPDSVSVLILPAAVGGSTLSQWLGDSLHRGVHLLTNFREKVDIGKRYGTVKGILWHQGESDAFEEMIKMYPERLSELMNVFRSYIGDSNLPIVLGELGSFYHDQKNWGKINMCINDYAAKSSYTSVISTAGLPVKDDMVHFNGVAQREMGKRFAKEYLRLID